MAIYICEECGNYIDGDWNPCAEHPTIENGLVCPDCACELEDEDEEDPTPYCSSCGALKQAYCACGPIPEND